MKRKSGLMRFLSLMLAMGTVLASVLPSAGQRVLAVGASSSAAERLVAHYKFNGDFNDTCSNSFGTTETMEGGTQPTLVSDSTRGQVMQSGSGKGWAKTANPLQGKDLDGFTVGAWVKANAVDTWNGIWSISSGAGGSGSHGIVVWESDDLVNWSEPWIAEIAPENAGCTWAPEFIYDAKTGEYVVYWSATTIELNENEEITQEYENHAIYYAKTRDFRTFTEPVLYHAGGEDSSGKRIKVIDSTMIEDGGKYYRYTKNESRGVIEIDVADSVLGNFTPIESTALSATLPSQQGAVEGPIIFKLNEKSADGKTQWCLMVDRFARGQGYYPLITTNLASGDFTLLDNDDFSMPSKYRHGYVMPVTAAEYDALQRAYGNNAAVEEPVAVTGVTLNTNTVALTVGQSTLLIATVAPEDAANRNVRWTSSDSTIAAVYSNGTVMAGAEDTPREIVLEKSNSGNPMLGFDANGDILYGGDPSILVDGDTVYCYVGHDASDGEYYSMPDWRCYSTTDMKTWKYESTIMTMQDISWRNDDVSAWASQVAKGSDGKYYFYYCAEGNASVGGGKCIGVAMSNSAKEPFKDIRQPLVRNIDTPNGSHSWEDIDPTVWIETDKEGVEHRYLGWGNNRFFVCELNADMTSIKDRDGDPNTLSVGYYYEGATPNDIVVGQMDGMEIFHDQDKFDGHAFTEAPYYYRQQDENGNFYGPYYMFFACDWREQMAYATTDDIMTNSWKFGGVLMEPSATGNTNHMAVFDFKGHTYFVYHDGSLPHGSGFRRVACIEEITINEDGTIDPIAKTAVGLTGTVSTIADYTGAFVASETFENTLSDGQYPITDWSTSSLVAQGSADVLVDFFTTGAEKEWEIVSGKADETEDAYVSIESNYKPGLYLAAADGTGDTIGVVLAQDAGGTALEAQRMTFRTLTGLVGKGVTFESVLHPGYYLVSRNGDLLLAKAETVSKEEATFFVSTEAAADSYSPATVQKTTRLYPAGSTLNTDDIRITVQNGSGQYTVVEEYTTNAAEIDMRTAGDKTLTVTYECGGEQYQAEVTITVVDADYRS